MRLDGRMEVAHAGEAKPERTGPTHLCSLVSRPSSPCPLAPPALAVSDFSEEPCCLRTFAQFFLPETFFFCLCFCSVKIGFFIPFDLLSDLVSSERSSVTILAKWVLMTLGSVTLGHLLYPFLSSFWSSALIMLLASSFMVCLSHQTLSSMTTGGWLPSYCRLFVTEPNTCSRAMLRKCRYLGARCPKVDIPGVDALCQLKEMFQFFKGGTSFHQGA